MTPYHTVLLPSPDTQSFTYFTPTGDDTLIKWIRLMNSHTSRDLADHFQPPHTENTSTPQQTPLTPFDIEEGKHLTNHEREGTRRVPLKSLQHHPSTTSDIATPNKHLLFFRLHSKDKGQRKNHFCNKDVHKLRKEKKIATCTELITHKDTELNIEENLAPYTKLKSCTK
ncbi:hypothetical protein J6590_105936, partial [Homalodisca vitripennis]